MISTNRPVDLAFRRAIGRRVRRLRDERDLTYDAMAFRTGLSAGFIHKVEAGSVGMSVDSLAAIAGALGVKPGWFFEEID